jgi:LmbE family N-acetylglucosaminyl deacetylase
MNILCVAAHPDDELLGCAATLRKLKNEGHSVYTCILCGMVDARHGRPDLGALKRVSETAERIIGIDDSVKFAFPNIRFNTVPHLEIVQAVEKAIEQFRPQWVFTHHPSDLNVDHRVCYEATMAAIRLPQRLSHDMPTTMIRRVYLFEVLSSTDWAAPVERAFQPNSFFDVESTIDAKVAALEAFDGALKPFPHSRSSNNVRHLAYVRGAQAGVTMAEAFSLVRDVNL